MGIIIDTNIFIDAENKCFNLEDLEQFSKYDGTFIAAITVAELYLGVHLAPNDATRIRREIFVDQIIKVVPTLPFAEEVAKTYSRIYSIFIKPRSKLGSNVHDLQIAATALTFGYPLLTCNSSDFKKSPGLEVLNPKNTY